MNTSSGTKMRWRCTFAIKNRYLCRAKAWTYLNDGIESVSFDGVHCDECYFNQKTKTMDHLYDEEMN